LEKTKTNHLSLQPGRLISGPIFETKRPEHEEKM